MDSLPSIRTAEVCVFRFIFSMPFKFKFISAGLMSCLAFLVASQSAAQPSPTLDERLRDATAKEDSALKKENFKAAYEWSRERANLLQEKTRRVLSATARATKSPPAATNAPPSCLLIFWVLRRWLSNFPLLLLPLRRPHRPQSHRKNQDRRRRLHLRERSFRPQRKPR